MPNFTCGTSSSTCTIDNFTLPHMTVMLWDSQLRDQAEKQGVIGGNNTTSRATQFRPVDMVGVGISVGIPLLIALVGLLWLLQQTRVQLANVSVQAKGYESRLSILNGLKMAEINELSAKGRLPELQGDTKYELDAETEAGLEDLSREREADPISSIEPDTSRV
ncbi:MAG: hypothetical protein MMC23_007378 [Stictis urceolatum]|nr:hypothetical protein [Stictis urceolata]